MTSHRKLDFEIPPPTITKFSHSVRPPPGVYSSWGDRVRAQPSSFKKTILF